MVRATFHAEGGGRHFLVNTLLRVVFGAAVAAFLACTSMAEELASPPFVIEYTPADAAVARDSADLLQAALREFAPRLRAGDTPIRVIIAGTRADFVRQVGMFSQFRVAGVARPDQGRIILQSPRIRMEGEDYNGTLRHELLHVLLYRNTNTEALPRWLNEGLCMSFANEYYWESTTTVARMFFMGRVIPLHKLDQAFTTPGDDQAFSDAYAQALSLVHFMREHLGDDTFWHVVLSTRDKDFEVALKTTSGWDMQDLWSKYHASLWSVALLGALASGSLFGPAAVLVVIAWWRIRSKNRRRMAVMEEQERHEPIDVSWQEINEDDLPADEEQPRQISADP